MRRNHVWAYVAAGIITLALTWHLGGGMPSAFSEPPAKQAKPAAEPADNSYCYACHANYEDEKLVHVHQVAGVGCEKCHGPSVRHSGDEDNITPPDKMYPKDTINAFCYTCHAEDKMRKKSDHTEWYVELYKEETCNECHGKAHRLQVRTRRWDKRTGKLVKDDGVRMMQKDSPATQGAGEKPK